MFDLKNDARELKYSNMKLNLENFELGLLLFPCPSLTRFSHCHIPLFYLSLPIFIPLTTHLQLHTPLIVPITTFLSLYHPYPCLNPPLSLKLHSYPLNPLPSILLSFIFSIHFLICFLSRLFSCMHGHLTSSFLSLPNLYSFSIHHALRFSSISSTSLPCIPIFLSHVCHHLHETLHHHFSRT